MDQKKAIKKLIKSYVKEALLEVLSEMNLKSVLKNDSHIAPKQKPSAFKDLFSESTTKQSSVSANETGSADRRKILLEKMGVVDGIWKDIYEDTAKSNNPILNNDNSAKDPEFVSEEALSRSGLMKDYSKFLEKQPDKDGGDWKERRDTFNKTIEAARKRTA